jgi:hypothetical protein
MGFHVFYNPPAQKWLTHGGLIVLREGIKYWYMLTMWSSNQKINISIKFEFSQVYLYFVPPAPVLNGLGNSKFTWSDVVCNICCSVQ